MVVEDAFATPGDSARLAPGAPGISQAAHGRRPRRAPRRAARAAASSRSDLLVALLANPESGRGEAREAERLLQEHGAELRRFTLARAGEAAESGASRIVVAGGDGSIGCAAQAAARAEVPLVVVPVGTANDFARALGIPLDARASCRLAVAGPR